MKLIGRVWTWFRRLKWWGKVLVVLGLLMMLGAVLPKKDEQANVATAGTTVATVATTAAPEPTTEAPPATTTSPEPVAETSTSKSTTTTTGAPVEKRNIRTFESQSVQGFNGPEVLTTWATCKRVVSKLAKSAYIQPDITFANATQADGEVVFFSDGTTLQIASKADIVAGAARERISFVCEFTKGSDMVRLIELNGNAIG